MGQFAQRFRSWIVHAKVLRAWRFGAALAIAIMAGVAVQPRHLPVHTLLRGELGGVFFLHQLECELDGAFFKIVEVEAWCAAGLFGSETALVC